MKEELTLGLIKPNATKANLIGSILKEVEAYDLKIVDMKMLTMTQEQAGRFYQEHQGKPFFQDLVDFMTSAPIVAFVLQGENAVSRYRELMGATDPQEAAEGTLRKMFAQHKNENSVHGSDSQESAMREIEIMF